MAGHEDFPDTVDSKGSRQIFTTDRRGESKFDIYKITTYNKHFNNFDLLTNTNGEKPIRMDSFYKFPEISPDGPIMKLNEKEQQDFRECQQVHAKHGRHHPLTSSDKKACQNPLTYLSSNPKYKTSSQEYGKYPHNRHTVAFSYHGLETQFSNEKTAQGMYRNNSFNL